MFIVTHRARDLIVKQGGTAHHVATGGIAATLARAKEATGGKGVVAPGGADVIRQFVGAGLVDELRLHQVSVLLGGGTGLFEAMGPDPSSLSARG